MPSYDCVIIGSGTLAARCGDLLCEQGHRIAAVVAGDEAMRRWADSRGLRAIDPRQADAALAALPPFDLLFSIVSPLIVSPAQLALPQVAAINYHDSPLPRYAGTHATTWALINREAEHGITWHLMTEQIDAGDILVQERFPIAPGETALSLNARCYAAALRGFTMLLDDLAADRLAPTPQDLSARTYFPIARRPAAAATIAWSQPAAAIDALIRALDFGGYPNYLALPKLLVGSRAYLVADAAPLEGGQKAKGERQKAGQPAPMPDAARDALADTARAAQADAAPGTILDVSDERLLVATGAGALAIRRLLTVDGQPIAISAAGLAPGMRLPDLEEAEAAAIGKLHRTLARHELYWAGRFAGLDPLPAPSPLQFGARGAQTFSGAIPPDLLYFLSGCASDRPADALTVVCAAFLGRLADRDQFDIGLRDPATCALTPWPQLFADTLPLELSDVRSSTLAELLARFVVARDDLAARATYLRDLPARHPELRADPPRLAVVIDRSDAAPGDVPGADLVLHLSADRIAWRSQSGEEGALERLHRSFLAFLAAVAAAPSQPIGRHSLLDAAERRLLAAWNATAAPFPEADLASLFEAQAARTPDAPAIRFGDEELSYRELDRRACQLAHALQARGVGPERIVAVCVERSVEMVVAMLGILKSGGAYLPLDPGYPSERLAFMLRDSGAALILAQQAICLRLADLAPADAWLCLDRDWPAIAQLPEHPPARSVGADQLAYVIYTSGSTGVPKGVMVTQRGIGNLAQAQIAAFGLEAGSRELQFASFGFDASVSEIVTALLAGATLYLAPQEQLMPGADLARLLQQAAISVVTLPPSVLALLEPSDYPDLRTVVSAGEACPPEVVARWAPGRRLINAYGPTEATVCATMAECRPDGRRPTIGRPIANTTVQILDRQLQPLPVGVAGELCIGGVGLARGYLNRPELSAERFVTTPGGERLYRTGDLARWLPGGEIAYLGRIDQQVKLRGYRIELGEIESALRRRPEVRQALAILREEVPGDRRLVAYVAIGEGDGPADAGNELSAALRAELQARLPAYMVPSAIVILPSLPLTRNGKIDLRALPAARPAGQAGADAPRTPTEREILAIWREVLRIDGMGIHDHFFELGGHSLLATQVVSRIREQFQIELPLSVLMGLEPTIAATAAAVEVFLIRQADPAALAALMAELEQLSDDEVMAAIES